MSTPKFPNLLRASKGDQILAVIENLPVDANGYFLTEQQATAIEEELAGTTAAIETANNTAATAITAQQTAEAALLTANATIATHVSTIEARDARITELEAGSGEITQTVREKDQNEIVAFHNSPDNPMNAIRNKLFPGLKK